MNDIPDSVIQQARQLAKEYYDHKPIGAQFEFDVQMVARAILNERQACEKIVRDRAKKLHEAGYDNNAFSLDNAADTIAARSK